MRARELTYRSKQTKEGGEVGSDDGPLLIARRKMLWKFGSVGRDYAGQGLTRSFAINRLAFMMSQPFPTQHQSLTLWNSHQLRIVKMLIQETHKDVPTKADGKEGSMSR